MDGFELRTARTTIRHWHPSEVDVLLGIRCIPEVAQWLGDPTPWTDRDQARAHLDRWAESATEAVPSSCAIVPDDTGVPVGTVTLARMPEPGRGAVAVADCVWLDDHAAATDGLGGSGLGGEVEVGWYLHPDAAGNGWASEAAAAMLDHGFAHGLERVWAVMWAHNQPSAAVARRLGMDHLGVFPDPWYGTAEETDSRFFTADRATWTSPLPG